MQFAYVNDTWRRYRDGPHVEIALVFLILFNPRILRFPCNRDFMEDYSYIIISSFSLTFFVWDEYLLLLSW